MRRGTVATGRRARKGIEDENATEPGRRGAVMIMIVHTSDTRRLWAGTLAAAALLAWTSAPASAQSLAERANRGLVEIATSSTLGTSVRMAEDLADVLDDGATRRIAPVVG